MTELGYASALGLGLAGAGHCLGMCGGIAAALNLGGPRSPAVTLAYHAGRISSYTLTLSLIRQRRMASAVSFSQIRSRALSSAFSRLAPPAVVALTSALRIRWQRRGSSPTHWRPVKTGRWLWQAAVCVSA